MKLLARDFHTETNVSKLMYSTAFGTSTAFNSSTSFDTFSALFGPMYPTFPSAASRFKQ